MALFAFEALNAGGKPVKGVRESDSPRQLRQSLKAEGLIPVSVSPAQPEPESNKPRFRFANFQRQASAAEIALITRQLSTLIGAAIPLEECLQALVRQVQKKHLKVMLATVRSRVLEGRSLADAMAVYPKAFNTLYRAMVAAGEKSGHLDTVLDRLADYTEQQQQIRSKLIQAMIYPVILTLVAVGVVIALLTTVVPTVIDQFAHMGQELPAMTRMLISASDFIQTYGLNLLLACLLSLVLRQRLLNKDKYRLLHDRWLLKMPVFGDVFTGVDTARFARTLSILSSSSVPLVEGMTISAGVLVNRYVHQQLRSSAEKVREGSALWTALDKTELFPPMMLHIIASGEKSGELEQMLSRAASNQDRLFENQVNIALGVFGPLLIVFMAGVVLFIVMAILTPMLDLNSLVAG